MTVNPLSFLFVLIGLLIIAIRAPMIFAPSATLRFFQRLIASDARVRGIGAVVAPLAVALIALPFGERPGAEILRALGWICAAATLWLLGAPSSYRRFAHRVLSYVESSVDEAVVRLIGLLAVAIGAALIYYGVYVV